MFFAGHLKEIFIKFFEVSAVSNFCIKVKKMFITNHVHNILRVFDGLANFPFTTSETKCDYK